MAIGDIPRIPRQYYPRLQQLGAKLENQEITAAAVQENALHLLGRARISADGICFTGEFGSFVLDREGLEAMIAAMKKALALWPVFHGRELFVQKGEQVTRWRLGRIPKKTAATPAEIQNSSLPVVIYPLLSEKQEKHRKLPVWLSALMDDPDSGGFMAASPLFKVVRIEELLGWFEDWEQLARALAIGIPALPLTQKKRLDKLGESLPAFIDALLTKCGV